MNNDPSVTGVKSTHVVLYSGGMDSYTLLQKVLHQKCKSDESRVFALSIFYGQRHSKELKYAAAVCQRLGINHKVLSLGEIAGLFRSTLTGHGDIPEGHYADENMKQTVVPNRNMLMLSIATGYAHSIGASSVYYGAHSGDHPIYPDCRPEFLRAFNKALSFSLGMDDCPYVETPFMDIDKSGILAEGLALGTGTVDYAETWTCYKGLERPCGKCGSCVERAEAFAENGLVDPLLEVGRE